MRTRFFSNSHPWCVFVLCLLGHGLQAQTIKGKVQDAKTLEILPFANVFLNNTTIGTTSDVKGNFELRSIKQPGTYELIVSFVGYETFKTELSLTVDETVNAEIKLEPSKLELGNIDVKGARDEVWEKQLKKFEKSFLGRDKMAAACKILNPWVIDFVEGGIQGKFIATADDPIEIFNLALGYKVMFYLKLFWVDKTGYSIVGNARFEEMQSPDVNEQEQWQVNRKLSYQRSSHHLFKAMIDHRIGGEGFRLYTEKPEYENATTRSANFGNELGKVVMRYDTSALVQPAEETGFYKIKMKGRVEVHYVNERAAIRTYRDTPHQVSWIKLSKDSIIVNKDGFELNPLDVSLSGEMSADRVARMLPLDYVPGKTGHVVQQKVEDKVFLQFQEKLYVTTDKPYYYSGEPLWFKGYLNYRLPGLRDSMSRTAYVEIIGPQKRILLSKTIAIDSGFFSGDFILPDTLSHGSYYLRAYTNFSRNYGSEGIFIKPLPVLNLKERVEQEPEAERDRSSNPISIIPDKPAYNSRDRIQVTIKLMDEEEQPLVSNLSISVTDASQVVPVEISKTMLEGYPFPESPLDSAKITLLHAVEFGIRYSGRFLNKKGKPEKATLDVLQLTPPDFTMTHSNDKGIFEVSGLVFFDTASVSVQARNAKGESYGKATLIPREAAPLNDMLPAYQLNIAKVGSVQRLKSEYELPPNSKMLEEIVVRAKRIVEEPQRRPYGKPDAVLTEKDINAGYGNLLFTLPGKVPGLIVRQVLNNDGEPARYMVYIQRAVSIANPAEVLVTVNDAIVGGYPADIIAAINPQIVQTIEVRKAVNVLYGGYGGNGIVAIYTKNGSEIVGTTKNLPVMKVPGYSPSRKFRFPNYEDPATDASLVDYRSLLYWNPNIRTDAKTGTATASFYAADLQGRYRIVVEGVTQNGDPVRCVKFIEINNR